MNTHIVGVATRSITPVDRDIFEKSRRQARVWIDVDSCSTDYRLVFLTYPSKKNPPITAGKVSHKSEISIEVSAEREMPLFDFEVLVCVKCAFWELIWRNWRHTLI